MPGSTNAPPTNLMGLPREGMRDFFTSLGERPFRATQVLKWIHHRHASSFDAMTDLGKALRTRLDTVAVIRAPAVVADRVSMDGNPQVVVQGRQRQLRGSRVHSRRPPRHPVRLVAGRLRAELHLLRDRATGVQPESGRCGDRRTALGRAPHPRGIRSRRPGHHQRGAHGHGRAAAEYRQRRSGPRADARRPWDSDSLASGVTLSTAGVVPGIRAARPTLSRESRGVAARTRRCTAEHPRANQPHVSNRHAAPRMPGVRRCPAPAEDHVRVRHARRDQRHPPNMHAASPADWATSRRKSISSRSTPSRAPAIDDRLPRRSTASGTSFWRQA